MYAKVYQYKFPGVSEAKIAASFCADMLGKKIVDFNFQGLNVMIGKDGDLSIIIKFEDIEALKKYETISASFIADLKKSFVFKENQYAGIYVYNYEKEATSNEIKISGPAVVNE
tara:strand:- start:214 stop:555 length:342 start_codon:yes stop_codon:yes gene_type:complete